jgi:hypothetical protein
MVYSVSNDDSMSSTSSSNSACTGSSHELDSISTISFDTAAGTRKQRRPSILILGASSRTGLECIQQLSNHPSEPYIHAFNEEDMPEMEDEYFMMCHTVIEGSLRHAIDIAEALSITGANWVVLCNDHDVPQRRQPANGYSTVCAKSLVHVLEQPRFASVRALVVSRIEAATTTDPMKCSTHRLLLNVRCRLRQRRARPLLQDLAGQEKQLHNIWDRVTVVRTAQLIDSVNHNSSRRLLEFHDDDDALMQSVQLSSSASLLSSSKAWSRTERVDLASYIVAEICTRPIPNGNRVINVMSANI